jgi:hypothetical protein
MAEVDTSFYRSQPKSYFDYLQEMAQAEDVKAGRERNRLQTTLLQGQLQDATQSRDIRNRGMAALQALGGGAGDEQRISALRGAGDYGTADTIEKGMLERRKTEAQTSKDSAEAEKIKLATLHSNLDRHLQSLAGVNEPQSAAAWLAEGVKTGVMDMQKAQALNGQLQSMNPQQFQAWKQQMAQGGLSLKDQIEQAWKQKGFDLDTQRVQEAQRHNKASEGLTARGQNLVDQRAREGTAAAVSKPFEVTGPDGTSMLVQQDRNGNITPVQGYSPKATPGGDKPLPNPVVKQLTEARDQAATIDRLSSSFNDKFAGKGILGFGANAQLDASGRIGADKDSVEWWKNYRKQSELVERHALFGAALTPGEQASWQSADISPGMDAKVIKRNLATRKALTQKIFENTTQDLVDAGHSEKRVRAISSRNTAIQPQDIHSQAEAILRGSN